MTECPICTAAVELTDDVILNELINCAECGTTLEITSLSPLQLAEAPEEEEDWGE